MKVASIKSDQKVEVELGCRKLTIGEIHSNQRRYRNLTHAEFSVAWKGQTIKEQMHNHEVSGERSDTSLRIGHINKQAIKTRDNFIESRSDTPLLDTKTATQLQIDDSYAIDNEMFERLTDALPTERNQQQPEKEILLKNAENETDEPPTQADEKTGNVLESILKEMNHE
jgi:hypothetical protein